MTETLLEISMPYLRCVGPSCFAQTFLRPRYKPTISKILFRRRSLGSHNSRVMTPNPRWNLRVFADTRGYSVLSFHMYGNSLQSFSQRYSNTASRRPSRKILFLSSKLRSYLDKFAVVGGQSHRPHRLCGLI